MWGAQTGWACWPVREHSSWERFSLSHVAGVLHLCAGTVDPLWDFVLPESVCRPADRSAHTPGWGHTEVWAHTCRRKPDISRRKDRWGGNGSKSRTLWYVRMKDVGKAKAEKGIHFSFPIVLCWQEPESVRDWFALTGLIGVRAQSNWALSSDNITHSQRECF